jgi:branched-subunit amino acid aminotransferase/4-amino-4-deoxychorismate lyase
MKADKGGWFAIRTRGLRLMVPKAPITNRLRWITAERGFVPTGEPESIDVVDSWLVDDGRLRALPAHIRRFSSACAGIAGIPTEQSVEFLRASVQRVPAAGRWFPRVELIAAGEVPELQLWIRPAPPRREAVRLWISTEPDRRVHPSVKGADLEYLATLRLLAAATGADEAVILSADGRVKEGASTSILWWRRGALCAPPVTSEILRGVTRTVLLRLAVEHGIRVEFEEPKPRDLDGLEVWAVNALHGIRPVHQWVGRSINAGVPHQARRWNAWLEGLCVPVLRPPADGGDGRTAVPDMPPCREE